MVLYSSEARGYATVVFFTLLAFLAIESYAETRSVRWLVVFWCASVLGLLSHPVYAAFLGALIAWCVLVQSIAAGFRIGEVSCPTRYFQEASSISFRRALVYGLGVLRGSWLFRTWTLGVAAPRRFAGINSRRYTDQR